MIGHQTDSKKLLCDPDSPAVWQATRNCIDWHWPCIVIRGHHSLCMRLLSWIFHYGTIEITVLHFCNTISIVIERCAYNRLKGFYCHLRWRFHNKSNDHEHVTLISMMCIIKVISLCYYDFILINDSMSLLSGVLNCWYIWPKKIKIFSVSFAQSVCLAASG